MKREENSLWEGIDGKEEMKFEAIVYIDDITLIVSSCEHLQEMVTKLDEFVRSYGMRIVHDKSFTM